MSQSTVEQIKNRIRAQAVETIVAFTNQLEELEADQTAGYANFVKQLLLLGSIPADPSAIAEIFFMEKVVVLISQLLWLGRGLSFIKKKSGLPCK